MVCVVRTRGRHISVRLDTVLRVLRLSSWRRLSLAVVLAAAAIVFVIAVDRLCCLPAPAPPRYAAFGVDRHPSVMRLLEADVLITRLADDDDDDSASDNENAAETVGVFVVAGLSTSPQTLSQHGTGSDLLCLPTYRYQIFIVTSTMPESSDLFSQTTEDSKQFLDDDVNNATARQLRRRCLEAGSTSVIVWQVQVRGGVTPSVVADLLTEAYVDNITWYDVIFLARMTSPFPVWRRWPPTELSVRPHVGIALKTDDVSTRVAFHRTHLDIFGDSWPHWMRTGADVATYLQDVYSADNSSQLSNSSSVRDERAWLRRYVDAIKASRQSCLPCELQREATAGNRKVISMSLYGDDSRYTIGALRNAQQLPVVFRGWKLRFYYRGGDVLRQLLDRLRELGAELQDVTEMATVTELAPMLWRMTALDDTFVDVLLSRDADSRLTDRDAAEVDAWLSASGRPTFHCIRDHPSHIPYSVNGGLWGARRRRLIDLVGGRPVTPLMANFGDRYFDDMRFLHEHVWKPLSTLYRHEIYCHDSVSCELWVGAHPFTARRQWPGEHVGQVFDAWTRPRQSDVDLLLNAARNSACELATQSNDVTVGHNVDKTSL